MRAFYLSIILCFSISFLSAQINRLSVLADGAIIKIPVSESGVYKLDYDYLKTKANLDIDNIDPKNISIYGNGGGMMSGLVTPGYNVQEQDLIENPIFVSGEGDGTFNSGDYILFYGEGANKIQYSETDKTLSLPTNLYDNENYYFLKLGSTAGKRIAETSVIDNVAFTVSEFDDVIRHEKEEKNLLKDWVQTQGSGRIWYGEQFKNTRSRTFDSQFNFPNIIKEDGIDVEVRMAARTFNGNTKFNIEINNQTETSQTFSPLRNGDNIENYCHARTINGNFEPAGDNVSLTINYPEAVDDSEAWLDFIEITAKRSLIMDGNQLQFRNIESVQHSTTAFLLNGANSNIEVWDITEATNVVKQNFGISGSEISFNTATEGVLKEFIAFDKNGGLKSPGEPIAVENQNVHGIPDADLVIVYHKDFEEAVERLADFRRTFNGYEVVTVRIDHILNEFSSGRVDPVGIRNFSKMMHDRNPDKYKWLLLFGDGSFDYKDVYGFGRNFIPLYETLESHNPVNAFPTDDYFALLTEGDGSGLGGNLDVSIGRIPVETLQEANNVVDKLINYDNDPSTMRDWRNRITLVSDDDEGESAFLHVGPSERHYNDFKSKYPNFNVDKLYLDAFPQIATSGGQKYPAVNEAIDQTMFKGVLLINYFGHGGPKGWAQERILKIENIINWDNSDRLPLFVTATCTFTGYDDPSFKSAGEEVFLNPNGGAFMLLSTTRAVYISGNERMVESVFERLFEKVDGQQLSIGENFSAAKNTLPGNTKLNSRKFVLIGDPSMKLALPKANINTTFINDHDVLDGQADTLRSLEQVTIEGEILDESGNLMTDFNGSVYPTIYDKPDTIYTLGQDPNAAIRPFELQKNILFKGKASVENGLFKFSFVMPKDINYEFGYGKISYYAENGTAIDAAGNYQNVVIGGSNLDNAQDDEGPLVEVYMNSEDFNIGGITSENPVLLVKLSDDNGINVAGTSIGHDLTAVLDGNNQNTFVLNDFYEAELNDFTKGVAYYPLFNLEEGFHKIEVTAWDVANNFGRGFTEFYVVNSEEAALLNVLNYPNPFTDETCISFEHNMAGRDLQVRIDIHAINGQLVKTIIQDLNTSASKECITWNGTTDEGSRLAKGVYVYNVKLKDKNLESDKYIGESEYSKMVILK